MILKHILFFALLLPMIQSTQVYIFFGVFNPKILIMPFLIGITAGYLIGYYRQRNQEHIQKLSVAKLELKEEVEAKTLELKQKNITLKELTLTDALTGLGNRVKLKKVFKQVYKQLGTDYQSISVMMIDIDYFKNYNDHYGHLKGDDVLTSIAKVIRESIEETDASSIRFGGEEFCIILPRCDANIAIEKANILVEQIRSLHIQHKKSDVSEHVTISIGVHTINTLEEATERTLINDADKALYMAKERGRDQVCYL